MMLTTLSYNAHIQTSVEPFPGTNTTCGAAATSVPTADGDYIGKLGFDFIGPANNTLLGSFPAGGSKTVTVQYQCK
jgi:hypothetical protein